MKRLACFLLEGLIEQGPHRVWITLGTFDTAKAAQQSRRHRQRAGVIDTRIIALYRDSGLTAASNQRSHFASPAIPDSNHPAGITVA